MDYLAENTAPIWAVGAVLMTMAMIAYTYTRSRESLVAGLVVLVLTTGGLITERLIVTPREAVESSLRELLALMEANDLPGVLAKISPAASMRSDAKHLMPMFDIRKARSAGQVSVEMDGPISATATFQFFAQVRHVKSGRKAKFMDDVTLRFTKQGEQWVVSDLVTKEDWRREAAKL